jgi:hypothetical protein
MKDIIAEIIKSIFSDTPEEQQIKIEYLKLINNDMSSEIKSNYNKYLSRYNQCLRDIKSIIEKDRSKNASYWLDFLHKSKEYRWIEEHNLLASFIYAKIRQVQKSLTIDSRPDLDDNKECYDLLYNKKLPRNLIYNLFGGRTGIFHSGAMVQHHANQWAKKNGMTIPNIKPKKGEKGEVMISKRRFNITAKDIENIKTILSNIDSLNSLAISSKWLNEDSLRKRIVKSIIENRILVDLKKSTSEPKTDNELLFPEYIKEPTFRKIAPNLLHWYHRRSSQDKKPRFILFYVMRDYNPDIAKRFDRPRKHFSRIDKQKIIKLFMNAIGNQDIFIVARNNPYKRFENWYSRNVNDNIKNWKAVDANDDDDEHWDNCPPLYKLIKTAFPKVEIQPWQCYGLLKKQKIYFDGKPKNIQRALLWILEKRGITKIDDEIISNYKQKIGGKEQFYRLGLKPLWDNYLPKDRISEILKSPTSIMRKIGKSDKKLKFSARDKAEIEKWCDYVCLYCGKTVVETTMHAHHYYPESQHDEWPDKWKKDDKKLRYIGIWLCSHCNESHNKRQLDQIPQFTLNRIIERIKDDKKNIDFPKEHVLHTALLNAKNELEKLNK